MEGAGKQWQFRKRIGEIGKKAFYIVAENFDDRPGPSRPGEVVVQPRPLAPVDVLESSVSPKIVYTGEQFVIKARTTEAADKVYIEIAGQRHLMAGAITQWSYLTIVDREGMSRYTVVALNADGKAGSKREMQIAIARRPAEVVSVAKLEVNPGQGYSGEIFTFKATTDRPAQQVNLIISGTRYKMKGSGKAWVLERKIRKRGTIAFSATAVKADGKPGGSKSGFFMVKAHPVKVVKVQTPKAIYAGEDYIIQAPICVPT